MSRTGVRFKGRVVFVTGGASGIGAAISAAFAEEGARVLIADIQEAAAVKLAASLPGATAIALDVADPDAVGRAFEGALASHGAVHVVVNNAGVNDKRQRLHETDLANWRRITSIDGDGFF